MKKKKINLKSPIFQKEIINHLFLGDFFCLNNRCKYIVYDYYIDRRWNIDVIYYNEGKVPKYSLSNCRISIHSVEKGKNIEEFSSYVEAKEPHIETLLFTDQPWLGN